MKTSYKRIKALCDMINENYHRTKITYNRVAEKFEVEIYSETCATGAEYRWQLYLMNVIGEIYKLLESYKFELEEETLGGRFKAFANKYYDIFCLHGFNENMRDFLEM